MESSDFLETYVCMNTALFRRSLLHLTILGRSLLICGRSLPVCSGDANTFRKGIPNRGINFKDAYCMCIRYLQ